MADNKLATIEEALRVIKTFDDKSHIYENQIKLLSMPFEDDERGALDYFTDLMEEIVVSLREAEELRKELLESMEEHIKELRGTPDEEPYRPRSPLLRRSGKR